MSTVLPGIPTPGAATKAVGPDQTAALVRSRIEAGTYVPGARITLTELRTVIPGAPEPSLRDALNQLAADNVITGADGLWRSRDDRPRGHAVTRTHGLLASMIDNGAYPTGALLPFRHLLTTILTAGPDDVRGALGRLASDRVIQLAGAARPRVLAAPPRSPARTTWPPASGKVYSALPSECAPGADYDRVTLGRAACAARERYRSGICPAPEILTSEELRLAYVVRALVTRAYRETAHAYASALPDLRSAAARVMTCHAIPADTAPHERLFRLAVLATALHDLASALPRPS
ncbi:hypothetical protein [Streptomyces sp. NPDC057682]|uniref:hypothetical protein n=1 Tax=Streptomyces sp. NPDC057682 TaxID=3346210 RepID=UPI003689615E